MSDAPSDQDLPEEAPPWFSSWRNLYLLVLIELIILIVLFYLFSAHYA